MEIQLFVTGGTIDAKKIVKGKKILDKTHINKMLKQGKSKLNIKTNVLLLKLSYKMTDDGRKKILENCKASKNTKILITHGTDTIEETAR